MYIFGVRGVAGVGYQLKYITGKIQKLVRWHVPCDIRIQRMLSWVWIQRKSGDKSEGQERVIQRKLVKRRQHQKVSLLIGFNWPNRGISSPSRSRSSINIDSQWFQHYHQRSQDTRGFRNCIYKIMFNLIIQWLRDFNVAKRNPE